LAQLNITNDVLKTKQFPECFRCEFFADTNFATARIARNRGNALKIARRFRVAALERGRRL
jgi:hypothetical protein